MPRRSVPFIAKPDAGASIDWSNPVTRGLEFCLLTNEGAGYPRDLVSGLVFNGSTPASSATQPDWVMSRGGVTAVAPSTIACGGLAATASQRAATAITAVIVIDDTVNSGIALNTNNPVLAVYDGLATDWSNWSIYTDDGAVTANGWYIKTGTGNNAAYTAHSGGGTGLRATVGGGLKVYGFVGYNSGSDAKWDVWAQGVFRETLTITTAQIGGNAGNTNIKTHWVSTAGVTIVARAFWHRNLKPTAMARITASPLAFYNSILQPRQRRRVMAAAAGATAFPHHYYAMQRAA